MKPVVVEVGYSDLELVFDYFTNHGFSISNVSDDGVILAIERCRVALSAKKAQLEGQKFSDAIKNKCRTYTEISVSQADRNWYVEFEVDEMDLCDLVEAIGETGVITVQSRQKPNGLFYKLKINFNQVEIFLNSLK